MVVARRAVRFAVALAVVLPGPLLLGTGAHAADTTTSKATTSVWFWRDQQVVEGEVIPPSDPTAVAGDLQVSGPDDQAGVPDKTAWLRFDDFAYPTGTQVSTCALTVAVDTANSPLNAGSPAAIVAVQATGGFAGTGGPQLGAAVPTEGTDPPVAGVFDAAASTYTFAIRGICQHWVDDQNIGVGLRTAAGATSPLAVQLVAASASLRSEVTVPTAAAATEPDPSPSAAPTSRPSATSTTAPAVVVPPAVPAPQVVVLPESLLPATQAPPADPQVAAPTVAADGAPAITPTARTVADLRAVHSGLPTGFWLLAILLLALGAGFGWLLLAAPATPSAYRPRRSVLSSHNQR